LQHFFSEPEMYAFLVF